MPKEIRSTELWDRLYRVLGSERTKLSPRPEGNPPPPTIFDFDKFAASPEAEDAEGDIASLRQCADLLAFEADELGDGKPRLKKQDAVTTWLAQYEYKTPDGTVRSLTARYIASDYCDAVVSSVKFWMNRQRMPELYESLLAASVRADDIGHIQDDGTMFNGTREALYEWKIDREPNYPFEASAMLQVAAFRADLRDRRDNPEHWFSLRASQYPPDQ